MAAPRGHVTIAGFSVEPPPPPTRVMIPVALDHRRTPSMVPPAPAPTAEYGGSGDAGQPGGLVHGVHCAAASSGATARSHAAAAGRPPLAPARLWRAAAGCADRLTLTLSKKRNATAGMPRSSRRNQDRAWCRHSVALGSFFKGPRHGTKPAVRVCCAARRRADSERVAHPRRGGLPRSPRRHHRRSTVVSAHLPHLYCSPGLFSTRV